MSRIQLIISGLSLASAVALSALAFADDDHPHHGPPPEAFTPCEGKADGDACTVRFHDEDHAGTCHAPHDATKLACRPNDLPPQPPHDR